MSLIKAFRKELRMSQTEFANKFGIPVGTIRNWEQGISEPPDYVFNMLESIIWRDSMINTDTVKFMLMIKELAEKTKNGYKPFNPSLVRGENTNDSNMIIYDESAVDDVGAKVVLQTAFDVDCIDIAAYYDSYVDDENYKVRYRCEEDIEWVEVIVKDGKIGFSIVIEDGDYCYVG